MEFDLPDDEIIVDEDKPIDFNRTPKPTANLLIDSFKDAKKFTKNWMKSNPKYASNPNYGTFQWNGHKYSTKSRNESQFIDESGNPPGTSNAGYNFNWNNLLRAGKLANAFSADKYQRKMAKNVYDSTIRSMSSNVPEYYSRFQDYGLRAQYNEAAANIRKPSPIVNSDINAVLADQRIRDDQAIKYELEGGLKQSQLYSDWTDNQNQLKRDYAAQRTSNENNNRARIAAAENAYWTQLGASKAQRQNIIDNALTEQMQAYEHDRNMNYQLASQQENLDYNTKYNNMMSTYNQKLKQAIANGSLNADATLNDYFASNPSEFEEYKTGINDLQEQTYINGMNNYRKYNQQSIFSWKKGGVVNTKKSASDQIWINNQKISANAIKQLSKQAFEFLKRALS